MSFFERLSSPRIVALLFALYLLAMLAVNGKPLGVEALERVSHKAKLIDKQFGYSADAAYRIIGAYDEQGRAAYRRFLAVDFAYIPVYSLFMLSAMALLIGRLFARSPHMMNLALLPLLGGVADALENICTLMMLGAYPRRLDAVAELGSVMTVTKFTVALATLAMIGIGIIALAVTLVAKSKKPAASGDHSVVPRTDDESTEKRLDR